MANICCDCLKNKTEPFSDRTKGAYVSHFHNNKPVFTDEESFMGWTFQGTTDSRPQKEKFDKPQGSYRQRKY